MNDAVRSVVVLGGSSEIGVAIAAQLAGPRHGAVVLAGRHPDELSRAATTVRRAGAARVETLAFDATDVESHQAFVDGLPAVVGDVDVVIVRPGFVHTKMTAGRPAAPLATTPEKVGKATVAALASGRAVVWVPGVLRPVMALFRHLPRAAWRRLPA